MLDVVYAGFWRRFAAGCVDALILLNAAILFDLYSEMDYFIEAPVPFLLSILYFGAMESSKLQASCGMLLFGIKIVDDEGNRISFWRAAGREIATLISMLTLGIGYLMIAFTKKKQALHDMIADTLVIKA